MKNSDIEIKGDNNRVGDEYYQAKNKGIDIVAELCPLLLDTIYATSNNDDYSLTIPFKEENKIDFIDNKIIKYKESLKNFWRVNQSIENVILIKNNHNPAYAGRIYGRFKILYEDNKAKFINKDSFGDNIIDFIREEIKIQIKEWHDLEKYPVSDLQEGIRFLTFHAFYKCKILENPNDSK